MPSDSFVDAETCEQACRNPDDNLHTVDDDHVAVATMATMRMWPSQLLHVPPNVAAVVAVAAGVAVADVAGVGDGWLVAVAGADDVDTHRRHRAPTLPSH